MTRNFTGQCLGIEHSKKRFQNLFENHGNRLPKVCHTKNETKKKLEVYTCLMTSQKEPQYFYGTPGPIQSRLSNNKSSVMYDFQIF